MVDAACPNHGHDAIPSTRHVPVRASAGFGPANIPLSEAPTVALAFALGAAVSTPQRADRFGPFCAMVEELAARKVPGAEAMAAQSIMGSWDTSTELGALLAVLPARMAVELNTLYSMMRGQRWKATGRPDQR